MALFREHSDVSVRPATPQDEGPIAQVQLRAWRLSHGALLGEDVLAQLDEDAVRRQWAQAITAPPSPQHRVLVACAGAEVVGLAAFAPAPGGVEVLALEVDPDHQRGGHGSRLLTACVDLAREAGADHLETWVLDGDGAREQFLAGAGLGPDGTRRQLAVRPDHARSDDGVDGPEDATGTGRSVAEHRWVADI